MIATPPDLAAALRTASGAGVRIGLLDTGVESRHPDLAGRLAGIYRVVMDCEDGRVEGLREGSDPNAHGSACADIVSRLAPAARLHSVQIIGGGGGGDSPRKLIAGLRFALDRGWDIITISAGAARPHGELHRLVRRAEREGRIIIAAVDNRRGIIGYPAAYPGVFAVDMEHFEDPLALRFSAGAAVELEAKGVYIEAACAAGGRRHYTGSSFAAPHVAAIAARLKQAAPELDAHRFRAAPPRLSSA